MEGRREVDVDEFALVDSTCDFAPEDQHAARDVVGDTLGDELAAVDGECLLQLRASQQAEHVEWREHCHLECEGVTVLRLEGEHAHGQAAVEGAGGGPRVDLAGEVILKLALISAAIEGDTQRQIAHMAAGHTVPADLPTDWRQVVVEFVAWAAGCALRRVVSRVFEAAGAKSRAEWTGPVDRAKVYAGTAVADLTGSEIETGDAVASCCACHTLCSIKKEARNT